MLEFLTLVNDPLQYARSLATLKPQAAKGMRFHAIEPNPRGWNASQGLNHGLDSCRAEWVVCAHQDVLFPKDWIAWTEEALECVPSSVGIVGLVGTRSNGHFRGHILDPNGHCFWGPLPSYVLAVDESVLILRRSAGLRFDEQVPGFHCYGADLCLRARQSGLKVMVIDAPVHHLSSGRIDHAWHEASSWILNQWGSAFGFIIPTPAAILQDRRSSWLRRLLFRYRRRQDRLIRHDVTSERTLDFLPS